MYKFFLLAVLTNGILAQEAWWVTVYKDANFKGSSTTLGLNYGICKCFNYVGSSWNDVISSFDSSDMPIIWYTDANCKGSSEKWGRGKVSYVGDQWNDQFSSFKFTDSTC